MSPYQEWCAKQVQRPWVWGETDCVSLVRRGLDVLHGIDVADLVGGGWYSSAREAVRLFRIAGPEEVMRRAGWPEYRLADARDGDVVVEPPVDPEGWPHVGLVWCGHALLSATREHGVLAKSLQRTRGHAYARRCPGG